MSEQIDVQQLLQTAFPDVQFVCTGDGCHFQIQAVGEVFENLNRIKRQQLLNNVLGDLINSGVIHAVNYKLFTPEEAKEKGVSWTS
jgi:acid stress-induced BolA-like protein IbaG/YrbA